MFGWGDEFTYFQCARCGCLQIVEIPVNLGRYYPPTYYSFNLQPVPQHGLKASLAGRRDFSLATAGLFIGPFLNAFFPAREDLISLRGVPVAKDMDILDLGCGRGQLLSVLHRAGFGRVYGVDPYLAADHEVIPGVCVRKASLAEVERKFDLIMLHHVFEHVDSGLRTLVECRQHLNIGGKILIRIPTVESDAWEIYRENWVQLDAPRHLFLHTRKSLSVIAKQADLKIERCWCDSSSLQFWGSELYKRGVPLFDSHGAAVDPNRHFSDAELKAFSKRAKQANDAERGDSLVVVLAIDNANQ